MLGEEWKTTGFCCLRVLLSELAHLQEMLLERVADTELNLVKAKKKKSFKEQITSKGSQYAGLWTSSETKILGLRLRIGITNLVKEEDVGHMN